MFKRKRPFVLNVIIIGLAVRCCAEWFVGWFSALTGCRPSAVGNQPLARKERAHVAIEQHFPLFSLFCRAASRLLLVLECRCAPLYVYYTCRAVCLLVRVPEEGSLFSFIIIFCVKLYSFDSFCRIGNEANKGDNGRRPQSFPFSLALTIRLV